jgi:hypothetical protein
MTQLEFRYAPRKDNMLMDMKNLQQFNTDGISANDIWAMNKGCTDEFRYHPRKQLSWMRRVR